MEITQLIGKPLKLDEYKSKLSKPGFARCCVELNILDERPNIICIAMGDKMLE